MKNYGVAIALIVLLFTASCGGGSSSSKDPYLGTYTFIFFIDQWYKGVYEVDTKTDDKTSDGETIYTGYDTSDSNYTFYLAWSPSDNAVVAFTDDPYNYGAIPIYIFNISSSDVLSGCVLFMRLSDGAYTDCYSLDSSSAKSFAAETISARSFSGGLAGFDDGMVFDNREISPAIRSLVEKAN